MAAITIGGKDSSLSSSSVFLIANNLSQVRIDSSILDKLSSSSSSSSSSHSIKYQIPLPQTLTLEERRASLTVLLSQLLLISTSIRAEIPNLIVETLNSGLNSESVSSLSHSIDVDVTEEEKKVLDGLVIVSSTVGICALLDHGLSSLLPIAEAVSALSCEAANAKVNAFNLVDSGDGKCSKDKASVASDLKVLLNGSKLTGKVEVDAVSHIPQLYGSLREAVRAFHGTARVALSSAASGGVGESRKGWIATLPTFALVLGEVGVDGLSRVELNVRSIGSDSLRSSLDHLLHECVPSKDNLKAASKLALEGAFAEDYIQFAHNVSELLLLVRNVVSWEMISAVVSLGGIDVLLGSASKIEVNGENKVTEKKNEKRKKVLGKGTTAILQLVKDRVPSSLADAVDESAILGQFAENIRSFLDLRVPAFTDFSERIKEVLESNDSRRLPKLAKGTRDFAKEQMTVREKAFSIITEVFKRHGATALDTPVFELKETLTGKYGEDSKLIYDLADQGGELCSLRYDLTVPFARYVAMNSLTSFKRHQVAKVYRRDNPSKGRFREFYQCDFDIAGTYEKMWPDFEVIKVLTELLDELNIGDYEVKLNHRKLLDGMLDICGVPPEKFRTICSSVDKLDKQTFEQVKREMVDEKGLTAETADRIGSFVKERGSPLELLSKLKQEGSGFLKHEGSRLALDELDILFKALEKSKCVNKIVFDLSLARGLDYYTGVIFEAVFKGTTQVGSIAAGGRYDNLIRTFGSKDVPAVGVSLGIERVFAIMEQNQKDQNQVIRANETEVLVGFMGDDLSLAAELVSELWSVKIKAECTFVKKVVKIFERAEASGIPFAVMVGERELKGGIVKVRDIKAKKDEEVPRENMVQDLLSRLRNSS